MFIHQTVRRNRSEFKINFNDKYTKAGYVIIQVLCYMRKQRRNDILLGMIAKKLKELRSAKKLTQVEVYRQTKIHIGRIESGNSNITMSSLSELCKFYQISFEDFFKEIRTK